MSGLVNLFTGKGTSASTDRGHQLEGYGNLENVFNTAMPFERNQSEAGNENLGEASGYYGKILSGNREAERSAVAPELNTVEAQADQQKKQLSNMGTARGGGVNDTVQQIGDRSRGAEQQVLDAAKPEAAKGEAAIGSTQLGDALQAMGIGNSAANDLTGNAEKSFENTSAQNAETGQALAQMAMAAFM